MERFRVNRTTVELKPSRITSRSTRQLSVNRTTVELKPGLFHLISNAEWVLIVLQ